MTARLPEPRDRGRYRIAVVCLGNICRSPMAHVVLEDRLSDAGLADVVEFTRRCTGGCHLGDPIDHRAAATELEHHLHGAESAILERLGLEPDQ